MALTAKATAAMATSSIGLAKTRFIGRPMSHEVSTSRGATRSAIWMVEPTVMVNTNPIRFCRAKCTAETYSAALPTTARTVTPRKNSPRPSPLAVASSAPDTNSASAAVNAVATASKPRLFPNDQPLPASAVSPGSGRMANTSRCVTRV